MYRDQGSDRSLTKVALEVHKSRPLLGRWSRRDDWVARARAWDDELNRAKDAAQVKATVEMADRHARAAEALLGRGLQGLQTVKTAEMGPRDIAYMLDVAVKIERLSRGQPNERVEMIGLVVTPLIQQLITVFIEVNEIEDKEARAALFGERADLVVQSVVGRFLPSGIGGTAT